MEYPQVWNWFETGHVTVRWEIKFAKLLRNIFSILRENSGKENFLFLCYYPSQMWGPKVRQSPLFHLKDVAIMWFIERHRNQSIKKSDPQNYAKLQALPSSDYYILANANIFSYCLNMLSFLYFHSKTILTKNTAI